VLEFMALEESVWKVLNGFARHRVFIVPTGVWLKRTGEDVKILERVETGSGPGPAVDDAMDGFGTFRRQRLVSGPKLETPLSVRMELDVYTFRKD